ncbi:MAG: hypothetical protein WEF86_08165 [Gemmatimonadota bacterium]
MALLALNTVPLPGAAQTVIGQLLDTSSRAPALAGIVSAMDDGAQLPTAETTPLLGMSIDDLVRPLDLEAIEVYRGPSEMPAEFARGTCGAIVLWTRNGS